MTSILFAGYGDLARRVYQQLQHKPLRCTNQQSTIFHAIKRTKTPTKNSQQSANLNLQYFDLTDYSSLLSHLTQTKPDYIIVTLTASESSEQGYQRGYYQPVQCLLKALDQCLELKPLIFYVSSTSVYAQNRSDWVDEDSETSPHQYNGRQLLLTEQLLNNRQHCILRCSGLYSAISPRLLALSQSFKSEQDRWSNRIHRDDVAGFIIHLIQRHLDTEQVEPCYVVSDDQPLLLSTVLKTINPSFNITAEDVKMPNTVAGKRCNNKRLRQTDYSLKYPNYNSFIA